jgi:hypothetical protein
MPSLTYALWGASLLFAIVLLCVAWRHYQTYNDVFNPSTFVAIWFFFLYPVEIFIYLLSEQGLLVRSGLLYPHKQPVEHYLLMALLLGVLGWIGWVVGWQVRLGNRLAKHLSVLIPKQLKPGDLKPVAVFYALLGVSSIALIVYASGGPRTMLSRGDFAIQAGLGLGLPAILTHFTYAALGLFLALGWSLYYDAA